MATFQFRAVLAVVATGLLLVQAQSSCPAAQIQAFTRSAAPSDPGVYGQPGDFEQVAFQDDSGDEPVYAPGPDYAPQASGGNWVPPELEGEYDPSGHGPSCGGCGCQEPCGEGCCETSCCCKRRRRPSVRAAAVFLLRDNPSSQSFFTAPDGTDAFNFNQFDFDLEPGVDFAVVAPLGCKYSAEARYLGVWDAEERVTTGPIPPGAGAINTTPPTPATLLLTTFINGEYEYDLHSGEINVRRDIGRWLHFGGGFRYIHLRERFNADFDFIGAPGADLDFADEVENNLFGIQLGAGWDFVGRSHWQSSGFFKAGLHYVNAERNVAFVSVPAGIDNAGGTDDDDVAFVGEAGVNVGYAITQHAAVHIGYQILWLEGVALAAEQLPRTGVLTPALGNTITTGIDVNGSVFFHGARAGFDVRF